MSNELWVAFREEEGGVEGNFGEVNIGEKLFVDFAAEVGKPVGNQQKIDLELEIVPDDLVKYLLGYFHFRGFAFHYQQRFSGSWENNGICPENLPVDLQGVFQCHQGSREIPIFHQVTDKILPHP